MYMPPFEERSQHSTVIRKPYQRPYEAIANAHATRMKLLRDPMKTTQEGEGLCVGMHGSG